MANETSIHARVDARTKSEAQRILNTLGITLSEAISLYLRQIIFTKGIPFDVKIPNALTAETLTKADRGEDVVEFDSVDELLEDLHS